MMVAPVSSCTTPQLVPSGAPVVNCSFVFEQQSQVAIVVDVVELLVVVVARDVLVVLTGVVLLVVTAVLLVVTAVLLVVAAVLLVVPITVELVVCAVVVVCGVVDEVLVDASVEEVVEAPGHVQSALQGNAPVGLPGSGQVRLSGGSHCSGGSTTLFPHTGPVVVVVVVDELVVLVPIVLLVDDTTVVVVVLPVGVVEVVVAGGWVVEVLPPAQSPFGPQASQQLGSVPMQAVPPFGARHAAAPNRGLQRMMPLANVRQQVTALALPHVEFEAQPTTSSRHGARSDPSLTAAWATLATQRTYPP
jgi:hypothetical protein